MYVMLFMIGSCLASFCCVIGERLPKKESFMRGRSYCAHCRRTLHWYELIPIVSFWLLRGRCRTCHSRIPISTFVLECVTGLLFVASVVIFGYSSQALQCILLILLFVIVTVSDLYYFIIPNKVLIFFTVVFCTLYCLEVTILEWRLLGALCTFCCLTLFTVFTRGGMGFGDVKLYTLLALVLPLSHIVLSLLMASSIGFIYASIKRYAKKEPLPFAPFIAIGTLISYFFGYELLDVLIA